MNILLELFRRVLDNIGKQDHFIYHFFRISLRNAVPPIFRIHFPLFRSKVCRKQSLTKHFHHWARPPSFWLLACTLRIQNHSGDGPWRAPVFMPYSFTFAIIEHLTTSENFLRRRISSKTLWSLSNMLHILYSFAIFVMASFSPSVSVVNQYPTAWYR